MGEDNYTNYPRPRRLKHYADMYGEFHTENPKRLSGKLKKEQRQAIIDCVAEAQIAHEASDWKPRLLDYGSGKGYQYLASRVHEEWGGHLPYCFDPGVTQLSSRPEGKFDGVICTDVMEHIEKEDLRDVIADIFNFLVDEGYGFVYFHICCRAAWKHFKDGRNLHATIEPPDYWEGLIAEYSKDKPHIKVVVTYEEERPTDTAHFEALAREEEEAKLTNKHAKKAKAGTLGS